MKLSEQDKNTVIERYTGRYRTYGHSPKTLGWDKGKQPLRFSILSDIIEPSPDRFSLLDIGCGFGDLYTYLCDKYPSRHIAYQGIDLVPVLVEEGKSTPTHTHYQNNSDLQFICADFLQWKVPHAYDYCFGSGIFNFKLAQGDNYQYIESIINKAFACCNVGVAFDFLSDKVDYQYEDTFHSAPEKILAMAYKLSRNVVLRNDYMPFEFAVQIFKDESFLKEDTIFSRYKRLKSGQTLI
ncbi:MAG: class I SAM-dependent methyltransferase [Bacteroidales bacterium]|nr:class I SAM-dependent methyltransferase [Bacteroidales bacterium]